MKIWHHGTTKENAELIRKNGFKAGTYFARHLEDAIEFGGNCVFEVVFSNKFYSGDEINPNDWQMVIGDPCSVDKIVSFTIYQAEKIMENSDLRIQIFDHNMKVSQ